MFARIAQRLSGARPKEGPLTAKARQRRLIALKMHGIAQKSLLA
ncbi:hypothetical protein [Shimia sp. MMG029]|nr:hypothetical protein [Shimia sp. MMG029]MDA5557305.1 hypothetical protein [Shimia sp. MMG029]